MAEEIQIQTVDEVKNIDYMKNTNEVINNQINDFISYFFIISFSFFQFRIAFYNSLGISIPIFVISCKRTLHMFI